MEPMQTKTACVVPDGMRGLRPGDPHRFGPPMLQPGQAGSLSYIAATSPRRFISQKQGPRRSMPVDASAF